jgi:hypothetical protein
MLILVQSFVVYLPVYRIWQRYCLRLDGEIFGGHDQDGGELSQEGIYPEEEEERKA